MAWKYLLIAGLCGLLFFPGHRARAEELDPLAAILHRSYQRQAADQIMGRSSQQSLPAPQPVALVATVPAWTEGDALSRVRRYDQLIVHHSAVNNLDADLVRAMIFVESGGDPLAVSHSGAAGLMQLMPATASDLGVANRFDPEQNIASGTRYLRSLLDRFQSTEVALWAYNAGPEAVAQGRMPLETRNYVPQVLRLRRDFKHRTPPQEN